MTVNMKWEFFPTTFYTTKYQYRQRHFNDWAKKQLVPIIEKDIGEKCKNSNWDCDVKTSYHLDRNVMNAYKHFYHDIICEFLHVMQVNTNKLPNYEIGSIWYNAYDKNDYQERHDHYPDHFSMIHFLEYNPQVHKSPKFFNPHVVTRTFVTNQINNRMYQPIQQFDDIEEGDIIFFPSFVPHLVEKNTSDKRRITVSLNLNLK